MSRIRVHSFNADGHLEPASDWMTMEEFFGEGPESSAMPAKPSKADLIAAYGTEQWDEMMEAYPLLTGLFEAASDALALEDQFDSMNDDQAWRAITNLAESLTDLVDRAIGV